MQQKIYDIFVTRYSPLLAYMMIPNMWSPSIGKLVFVMFDILAGHHIYCILRCGIIYTPKFTFFKCSDRQTPTILLIH